MEYKVESSLRDFPAWSGGKDTLDTLIEKNDVDEVESWIDGLGLEDAADTTINDILWFERDKEAERRYRQKYGLVGKRMKRIKV